MEGKRVAVVTGALAGTLAYGIAQAFATAGWDVCITGRHMKRLSQAAKQIAAQTGAHVVPLVFEAARDAGDGDSCQLAAKVEELLGPACVLVNASQAAKVGDAIDNTKPADLYAALDSGLTAAYLLMRAFYSQLAQTKGMVVNLVSQAAASGQAGMSLLAASKEGLRGMSRVAAGEWADAGVRVECLEPFVRTSAYAKWAVEYPDAAGAMGEPESVEGFSARVVDLASSHLEGAAKR